ncbi:hypothetical protein, partial [Klebsiella pneumoniae]|uniref:hypothetical protein n=1 Tax=Klebsiella pneumoniae TaxID=573 RepID=UPI003852C56C
QCLIDIPGPKILAHSPRLNQTRSELNSDYSDTLLARHSALLRGVENLAGDRESARMPSAMRRSAHRGCSKHDRAYLEAIRI